MIYQFVYRRVSTGAKIYSRKELHEDDLVRLNEVKQIVINQPVIAKKEKKNKKYE